jgi:uncharacterized membrane protein SirB2
MALALLLARVLRTLISLALASVVTVALVAGAIIVVNGALLPVLSNARWAGIGAIGCILFVILGGAVRAYRRSVAAKRQAVKSG